jgi:serine-type D-Ala-D-Ala carboxypeptidase/endopeptidase (penicillin-binding protein 4)
MKLATSYLALKHFGPEYRFKTVAYTFGKIDEATQTLYGDIIIDADGDPNFTVMDARALGDSIRSQGVRRVEGSLIINGPFRFRHVMNTDFAYSKLKSLLGVSFPKKSTPQDAPAVTAPGQNAPERVLLASHFAQPLKELLLYMNAHSDNFYAEQIGFAIGGPNVVQEELAAEFHVRPDTLYVSHTSGLDYNRISPRTSVAVLQKMITLLKSYQLRVEDIMPVAGVDSGTLVRRMREPGMSGGIVAKTGTLNTTDNGVSTLQGVIYSEQYGPMLFAIFNMGGGVHYFRREQDRFLGEALNELGTSIQTVRSADILQPTQELMAENIPPARSGRSMRVRRASARSRGAHGKVRQHHSVTRRHRR